MNILAAVQDGGAVTAIVVGAVVAAIPAVIGWLFVRAVRAVDRAIDGINAKLDRSHDGINTKLDRLVQQDTGLQVAITDLRARVVHLEYLVLNRPTRRPAEGE